MLVATGLYLEGRVLDTIGETVKVHLDIDESQNKETAYWFPFAPPTGSLMYCMPQHGTNVVVYIPDEDEHDSTVLGCVRKNSDTCVKVADPNIRYFGIEHGSEMMMSPTTAHLIGAPGSGNLMAMDDSAGVNYTSGTVFHINAARHIHMHAGKVLKLETPWEVLTNSYYGGYWNLSGETNIGGEKVKFDGESVRATGAIDEELKKLRFELMLAMALNDGKPAQPALSANFSLSNPGGAEETQYNVASAGITTPDASPVMGVSTEERDVVLDGWAAPYPPGRSESDKWADYNGLPEELKRGVGGSFRAHTETNQAAEIDRIQAEENVRQQIRDAEKHARKVATAIRNRIDEYEGMSGAEIQAELDYLKQTGQTNTNRYHDLVVIRNAIIELDAGMGTYATLGDNKEMWLCGGSIDEAAIQEMIRNYSLGPEREYESRQGLSTFLSMIPIVGDVLDTISLFTGRDIIDGHLLNSSERNLCALGAALNLFGGLTSAVRALDKVDDVIALIKAAPKGSSLLEKANDLTKQLDDYKLLLAAGKDKEAAKLLNSIKDKTDELGKLAEEVDVEKIIQDEISPPSKEVIGAEPAPPEMQRFSNAVPERANWRSVKEFGHTFNTHGAGAKNTKALTGRAARTGQNQGQWLDNQAAADFLKSQGKITKPVTVKIPRGIGQVITPTGEILPATKAIIVPSSSGIKTAYPVL